MTKTNVPILSIIDHVEIGALLKQVGTPKNLAYIILNASSAAFADAPGDPIKDVTSLSPAIHASLFSSFNNSSEDREASHL